MLVGLHIRDMRWLVQELVVSGHVDSTGGQMGGWVSG